MCCSSPVEEITFQSRATSGSTRATSGSIHTSVGKSGTGFWALCKQNGPFSTTEHANRAERCTSAAVLEPARFYDWQIG